MHQNVFAPDPMPRVVNWPEEDLSAGWSWIWLVGGTASEVEVVAAAAGEATRADETSTAAIEARRGFFIPPIIRV